MNNNNNDKEKPKIEIKIEPELKDINNELEKLDNKKLEKIKQDISDSFKKNFVI